MGVYARYLGARSTFLHAAGQLFLFRVQLAASLVMSVFLGAFDQSHDLYRAMALDWPGDWSHPLIACVTLLYAARYGRGYHPPGLESLGSEPSPYSGPGRLP